MKKTLSLFLSIVMLLSIIAEIDLTAIAAGNSISNATSISFNTQYSGYITANNEKDVYRFSLSSSGKINISVKANIYETNYYIYDASGNEIWNKKYCYWNDNTQQMTYDEALDLTKGTYYFAVVRYSGTGNYNFKITFATADETFSEPQGGNNNSIGVADAITLGSTYKGQLAINDDKDLYKFTLSSSGRINISVKANIYETNYYIYDASGNEIWNKKYCYWNDATQQMVYDETLDLSEGTYYFAVVRYSGTGNYSFNIHGHTYKNVVTKATLSKNGSVVNKCSVCGEKKSSTTIYYPKTIKLSKYSFTYNGKAQKPSVTVKDSKGNTLKLNKDYTVSYSNASSKNVGKYTVTIKFKGNYSGTKVLGYHIYPKPTEFVPSNKGGFKAISKGFTLKWNKQASQTTGYQIQYATKRDFSNAATITIANPNTTSYTIKGRAGNTRYYVRVRTYKKASGKTYYSSWNSGVKSVVTLR